MLHRAFVGQALHLKSLTARLVDMRAAPKVGEGQAVTATAHGEFLIITLAVTNNLTTPQEFDSQPGVKPQVALTVGEGETARIYSQSFSASNQADRRSFMSQVESIQPGETQTGDVVFDMPSPIASELATHSKTAQPSRLWTGDFGTEVSGERGPAGAGAMALNKTP